MPRCPSRPFGTLAGCLGLTVLFVTGLEFNRANTLHVDAENSFA